MAKSTRPDNPIEKLLQDRNQYLSWLARLDVSGDAVPAVPEAIRHKVRADYEARLEAVVEALRQHSTVIEEQLEEFRARRFELTNREMQAKEIMTEAEVRHAVGEYDEARWQAIRGETTRVLVTVREELTKTNTEIDRLVEVQALIVQPSPPAPPPAPAAPPPAPPAPAVAAVPPAPTVPPPPRVSGPRPMPEIPFLQLEPDFNTAASPAASASVAGPVPPEPEAPSKLPLTGKPPAGAPKTAPKPKEEQPARTLWYPSGKGAETGGGAAGKLDELAFLKSVSNEPAPPRRASGGFKTSDAVTPPPPPHTPSVPLLTTADPFASKSQPVVDPKRGSASVPKTLKCGECGTLNRPTEWYCERCGAELAAL